MLSRSRFLVVFGVFGSFLVASCMFLHAAYGAVETAWLTLQGELYSKKLVLACIEIVDLFLLATVFYIMSLGLYELFIDDSIPLPAWLQVHTLDDLKDKLLGVVVTVLAVLFLGQAVTWDGQRDLLNYGGGIALVVAAITFYGKKKAH